MTRTSFSFSFMGRMTALLSPKVHVASLGGVLLTGWTKKHRIMNWKRLLPLLLPPLNPHPRAGVRD